METNFRSGTIRWQISKHVKDDLHSFVLALIVNRDINI